MTEDVRLILSAVLGIGAAIALIVKGRFHPFLALLCGAFLVGLLVGMPVADTAKAVQKGALHKRTAGRKKSRAARIRAGA